MEIPGTFLGCRAEQFGQAFRRIGSQEAAVDWDPEGLFGSIDKFSPKLLPGDLLEDLGSI